MAQRGDGLELRLEPSHRRGRQAVLADELQRHLAPRTLVHHQVHRPQASRSQLAPERVALKPRRLPQSGGRKAHGGACFQDRVQPSALGQPQLTAARRRPQPWAGRRAAPLQTPSPAPARLRLAPSHVGDRLPRGRKLPAPDLTPRSQLPPCKPRGGAGVVVADLSHEGFSRDSVDRARSRRMSRGCDPPYTSSPASLASSAARLRAPCRSLTTRIPSSAGS